MIELKRLTDIAGAENGWLKAKHHFAGGVRVNGVPAAAGDGVVIRGDRTPRIEAPGDAEVVLVVTEDQHV